MIKRDFTAWDFVKQEPKKEFIIDVTSGTRITDFPSWTTTVTDTIVFGANITVGGDNRVYISDLVVQGSADIPPREGDMRTIMDEDGYWSTQVVIYGSLSVEPTP
jgi:hypothetical protein